MLIAAIVTVIILITYIVFHSDAEQPDQPEDQDENNPPKWL
jgi:hypothetical protein